MSTTKTLQGLAAEEILASTEIELLSFPSHASGDVATLRNAIVNAYNKVHLATFDSTVNGRIHAEIMDAMTELTKALASVPSEPQVIQFANAILHGDTEHRDWLLAAAKAFIAGETLPSPNGMGRAEAAESKLAKLQILHDLVIHEVPELEKEGYENIWGYLVHWDEVIKACNQAWLEPHGYSQSPLELIAEIINERDAVKAIPPQVDATLESIAQELRRIGDAQDLFGNRVTGRKCFALAETLFTHARKTQPTQGVNERLLTACEAARDWVNRFGEHAPIQFGGEADLVGQLNEAISAAESAAVPNLEKIEGLEYAVYLCDAKNHSLKNEAYRAACDEIKLSLQAAMERVRAGEQMASVAYVQADAKEGGK